MSRSPHRFRGDAAECWQALLFGEILRAIGGPATVRDDASIRLPRSGRWESGLGRIRPALDDALGATAFAVAWRWSCAACRANGWPGIPLIARHALDEPVTVEPGAHLAWNVGPLAASVLAARAAPGGRTWRLMLPAGPSDIGVSSLAAADWSEVDRIADIAAAWLDASWTVEARSP